MKRFPPLHAVWPGLRLTFEVWPLVARVRLALWREPFPSFYEQWNSEIERELREAVAASSSLASDLLQSELPQSEPDAQTRRLVWDCSHAVSRAARLVPRASCLTQALVLQRLLAQHGEECALFLGVDRRDATPAIARSRSSVEAHAWIEWRGRVLIGGDISRWTPFPLRPSRTPDAPR